MKRSTLRLNPSLPALTALVVAVAVAVAIEPVVQVVAVVLLVLLSSLALPISMSVIRPFSHPSLNLVFTKKKLEQGVSVLFLVPLLGLHEFDSLITAVAVYALEICASVKFL